MMTEQALDIAILHELWYYYLIVICLLFVGSLWLDTVILSLARGNDYVKIHSHSFAL